MLKKITAVLLVILMLLIPITLNASKISEYKENQDEAEENLDKVQSQKSAVMKDIKTLSDSIADNEDKLSVINGELVGLNREVKKIKEGSMI